MSKMSLKNQNTKLLTFFASLCLYLSAIEYALPKPLPFLRLGLANLPILLSLEVFSVKLVILLTLLKIFLQAFISGTFFSYIFVFSIAGSLSATIAMIFVYKASCTFCYKMNGQNKKCSGMLSFVGISVSGAFANNLAQIVCAKMFLFGENIKFVAPVLFIFGLVTGILLGIFCNAFVAESEWYNCCCGKDVADGAVIALTDMEMHTLSTEQGMKKEACGKQERFVLIKFVFCLLSLVLFLQIKNLYLLWFVVFFFFLFDEFIKKGRVKLLPSFVIVISVTLFALLTPVGKVLFKLGNLKITLTSLQIGLHKSGILVGMVFISQCAVDKNLKLPGKVGAFVANIFNYFDLLVNEKIQFRKQNVIKAIDKTLLKIYTRGIQ